MKIRIALLVTLLVVSLSSNAQAFKCRTPGGKVIVSNQGCFDGAQLEKITTASPMTLDRQLQAAEVNYRMLNQLDGIDMEKAAYNQQISGQLASQAAADKRQQAVTDQQKALEMARAKSAEANGRCIETATNRRNSTMLAECKGISKVQAQNELDAPLSDNQPLPAYEQPIPVVKSCNGSSCRDQYGNRYIPTVVPGKFDRSDGKRCKQIGNSMSCN